MPLPAVQPWPEPLPPCMVAKPSVLKEKATSQCLVVRHCKYCRAQEELSLRDLSWDRDTLVTLLMWFKEGINPSHAVAVNHLAMKTPAVARRSGRKFHPLHHSQQSAASSSQQHSSSGRDCRDQSEQMGHPFFKVFIGGSGCRRPHLRDWWYHVLRAVSSFGLSRTRKSGTCWNSSSEGPLR